MVSQLYQLRYEIQKLKPNNRCIPSHTLRNRLAKNREFVHVFFYNFLTFSQKSLLKFKKRFFITIFVSRFLSLENGKKMTSKFQNFV